MSKLPPSWSLISVGDVFDVVTGSTPPKSDDTSFGGHVPFVKPGDLDKGVAIHTTEETLTKAGLAKSRSLPPGTVLVSCIGNLGKVGTLAIEGACNQQINALLPSPNVARGYAHHWARTIKPWLEQNSSATTIAIINKGRFLEAPFQLPPLAEQRRIVAKLDSLTARTAKARAELERVPKLIAKYKQAILEQAFSGKLTERWRVRSGLVANEEIVSVIETPYRYEMRGIAGWARLTIGSVCAIEGGSQPPKSNFIYEPRPGYVRFVQIRDYKSEDHKTYIPQSLARRFCTKSDIMIARYGPPVFQILRGLEGSYNVALMKAVPKTGTVWPEFLFWLLQHPTLRAFVELDAKRTAGQDGVNKDHLERFPILLPSVEEQKQIVRCIQVSYSWLDKVATEHSRASHLLPKLDQAILTKAFRGELVPQDPRDEPASELLERIKVERANDNANGKRRKRTAA